jgi:hypothetical protein
MKLLYLLRARNVAQRSLPLQSLMLQLNRPKGLFNVSQSDLLKIVWLRPLSKPFFGSLFTISYDIHRASLKSATDRAAATHRLEKRCLVLEELTQIGKKRDQIIALHVAKLYSSSQARRELQKLEEREAVLQPPLKRGCVRSPSPVSSILQQSSPIHFPSSPEWDIANGNSLPSENSDIY